jgi:hypothetical protein
MSDRYVVGVWQFIVHHNKQSWEELMRRIAIMAAIRYFSIIILFTVAYWTCWEIRPDLFIINSQINLRPIAVAKELAERKKVMRLFSLEELNTEIKLHEAELFIRRHHTTRLMLLEERIKKDLEVLIKKVSDAQYQGYMEEEAKVLEPYEKQERDIEERIRAFNAEAESISEPYTSAVLRSISAGLEVDLSRVRLEKARHSLSFLKESTKHFQTFADDSLREELQIVNKRHQLLENEVILAYRSLSESNSRMHLWWTDAHRKRRELVGFLDFLYFSCITATTTGYGDIVPNNVVTRMFVSLEIMMAVIVIGIFFAQLGAKLRDPKEEVKKSPPSDNESSNSSVDAKNEGGDGVSEYTADN